MMGPGKPAAECSFEELVLEFEGCCRGGDHEFAPEYRAELLKRYNEKSEALAVFQRRFPTTYRPRE